ncbi:MAG: polyamine aminopropyltransferase [Enterococcus sp.]
MDLWVSDYHNDGVKFSVRVDKQLVHEQTDYQQIDIFQSKELGQILVLDGQLLTTDKDEFFYSEMMVHVAMATIPPVKKVLVIGGCDGGVLKELQKYDQITQIDVVELDQRVVEICQENLSFANQSFCDSRVNLYVQDGLRYVRVTKEIYDLIIVDSANPFGINENHFTYEFYGNCFNILSEQGILITQQSNGFYTEDTEAMQYVQDKLAKVFSVNEVYQTVLPSYVAGHMLLGFSSKGIHPLTDRDDTWDEKGISTKYYNSKIHEHAFSLPTYLNELIGTKEDIQV